MNIAVFAQPNPDPDGSDPDPTDAPIDQKLFVLLAIGLIFVAYKFYSNKKAINN